MNSKRVFYYVLIVFVVMALVMSFFSCGSVKLFDAENPLKLSHKPGVYEKDFVLKVFKASNENKIFYTLDGSKATAESKKYDASTGIPIQNSTESADFPITNGVKWEKFYGSYDFGYIGKATVLNLLEVDKNGNEVARKHGTFLIHPKGKDYFYLPVISLYGEPSEVLSMYNEIAQEPKIRMNMDYMDFKKEEFFSLNTQGKLGGNWTKGFPIRTINLNFNKDENGEKNKKPSADFFDGRLMRDGSGKEIKGDVSRFRLHSGGNDVFSALITDAFNHRVASEDTFVSTTAYRPCILYINGEYWGVYPMREHYSNVYFEYNYGVDKDNVIYVDKTYNPTSGKYNFDVKEGDEEFVVEALEDLYDFMEYDETTKALSEFAEKDWTSDEVYDEYCKMVDVEGLIDLILIHGYVGNWDFMYNNFRMWRTAEIEEGNKFADGKWRFIFHDSDFGFEEDTSDDGLVKEQCWDNGGGKSYFDWYLGNATMRTNNLGVLSPQDHLMLSLPAQNPKFKKRVLERAYEIERLFAPERALPIFNDMVAEIEPLYEDRVLRWGRKGYTMETWNNFLEIRRKNIENRPKTFISQVKSAFGIVD